MAQSDQIPISGELNAAEISSRPQDGVSFSSTSERIPPSDMVAQSAGANNEEANVEDEDRFKRKKRLKTSNVWTEFKEEEHKGKMKAQCVHCKHYLALSSSGTTSHLKRHLDTCAYRKKNQVEQQRINFPPSHSNVDALASGSATSVLCCEY